MTQEKPPVGFLINMDKEEDGSYKYIQEVGMSVKEKPNYIVHCGFCNGKLECEGIEIPDVSAEKESLVKEIEKLKHEYVLGGEENDDYRCMDCYIPAEDCRVNESLDKVINLLKGKE